MYDRILVPTDGSDHAERAMEAALEMAGQDTEVHALHVIDTRLYDTSIDSAVAPLRRDGERFTGRLADTAEGTGVSVTTAVELGRPAQAILDYVAANDVDLVVIGTRGRGGLVHRLLGSTTGYVVTHATVPVHVVPAVEKG